MLISLTAAARIAASAGLALSLMATAASADTPPAPNNGQAAQAATTQPQTPQRPPRRHCERVQSLGSSVPRRICYSEEEWAAHQEQSRAVQRRNSDNLDNCDRGGAMPTC